MNPGVMNPGGHTDIVDVGCLFEVRMDALDILDFEVAFPKGGRIDAVTEERPIADAFADQYVALSKNATRSARSAALAMPA